MNAHARLACQLAFSLYGLAVLVCVGPASAQSITPPSATQPTSASWSATNLPGASVYQDKLIGGALTPDLSDGDAGDDHGLARSLQIDGVVSSLTAKDGATATRTEENGVSAKAQWETPNYGAWSLDASAHAGGTAGLDEQGQGGTIALRQHAMPFDGGWVADNAVGDINTPDISMARQQPRFYLPTSPMQGLTTEWRGPDGLQVVAGGGVPGGFDGIVVPDFRTLGGSIASAGAQWSPAPHWTLGGQLIDAHDVNLAVGQVIDSASPTLLSSTTGLVSAAFQDHNEHLDLNMLDGAVAGKANGIGAWVDGSMTQGRIVQDAGLFRIDPNVTWGNQLIADDMQGGYYRLGYLGRRWTGDVAVDEVRSVSANGTDTTFLTADTRYQLSRDWGVGGIADVSRSNGGSAWSLQGYLDHPNHWGSARVQAIFADTSMGEDATLTFNQVWSMPVGMRLNTSTSVERVHGGPVYGAVDNGVLLNLAVNGGGQLTAKLGAEGNVNWTAAVQGRAAPNESANLSLTYQVAHSWELLLTYYNSLTGSWTPLTVVSPLSPPVATAVPAQGARGIFLTLRYQRAAGLHFAPLGGGPGAGFGEIAGMVYLDANNNGQFEAGEAGAPNVTVMLDGRFSVQTDANGRFHFPMVVTGHHVIKVISDNLPLPWALVGEGQAQVEVTTRNRIEINIGAQRLR